MENIIEDLFKTAYRFHQCRQKFRKDSDLANVEFFILCGISVMLEEKEEGITLGEIIKVTDMSMSAASKKITILEKKGLIERQTSKTDRRNVYITLTKEGEEICARERERKHKWLEQIVGRMGVEETGQMLRLMNRMFDIIEQTEDEWTSKEQQEGVNCV